MRVPKGRLQLSRWRYLWLAGLAVAGVACGQSAANLQAAIDHVATPADWRMAEQVVYQPNGGDQPCTVVNGQCPRVTRYYVATGTPQDAFSVAEQMLADVGVTLDGPSCSGSNDLSGPSCFGEGTNDYAWSASANPAEANLGIDVGTRSGPIVVVSVWGK